MRSSKSDWRAVPWQPGFLLFCTVAFLGFGFAGSVGVTASSVYVAHSAFFGIRAPAEPILGAVYMFLALLPWVAAGVTWWVMARRVEMRPLRFLGVGVALSMSTLVVGFAHFRII
jgi:hypothetical protein